MSRHPCSAHAGSMSAPCSAVQSQTDCAVHAVQEACCRAEHAARLIQKPQLAGPDAILQSSEVMGQLRLASHSCTATSMHSPHAVDNQWLLEACARCISLSSADISILPAPCIMAQLVPHRMEGRVQGRQPGGRVPQVHQLGLGVQQLPGRKLLSNAQMLRRGGCRVPAAPAESSTCCHASDVVLCGCSWVMLRCCRPKQAVRCTMLQAVHSSAVLAPVRAETVRGSQTWSKTYWLSTSSGRMSIDPT